MRTYSPADAPVSIRYACALARELPAAPALDRPIVIRDAPDPAAGLHVAPGPTCGVVRPRAQFILGRSPDIARAQLRAAADDRRSLARYRLRNLPRAQREEMEQAVDTVLRLTLELK